MRTGFKGERRAAGMTVRPLGNWIVLDVWTPHIKNS